MELKDDLLVTDWEAFSLIFGHLVATSLISKEVMISSSSNGSIIISLSMYSCLIFEFMGGISGLGLIGVDVTRFFESLLLFASLGVCSVSNSTQEYSLLGWRGFACLGQ